MVDFKKMLEEIEHEDQCKYKVIVAGGRHFTNQTFVNGALDHYLAKLPKDKMIIVEGGAKGADACGKKWAEDNGVMVKTFPAHWDLYGKRAGHLRNAEMAEYATHLVAFWDGQSRGTKNMIDTAKKAGLKVIVVKY